MSVSHNPNQPRKNDSSGRLPHSPCLMVAQICHFHHLSIMTPNVITADGLSPQRPQTLNLLTGELSVLHPCPESESAEFSPEAWTALRRPFNRPKT